MLSGLIAYDLENASQILLEITNGMKCDYHLSTIKHPSDYTSLIVVSIFILSLQLDR